MTNSSKKVATSKKLEMFRHTVKAVKNGEPQSRLFITVFTEGRRRIAWKCEIQPKGIWHPAFKSLLTPETIMKGVIEYGSNGSGPTAEFYPDSFYQQVRLADLKKLMEESARWALPKTKLEAAKLFHQHGWEYHAGGITIDQWQAAINFLYEK